MSLTEEPRRELAHYIVYGIDAFDEPHAVANIYVREPWESHAILLEINRAIAVHAITGSTWVSASNARLVDCETHLEVIGKFTGHLWFRLYRRGLSK